MVDLRVSLSFDGLMYYYNVRRLIYMSFVDNSIDYVSDGLFVINKDGNGYNNKVGNLKLVTKEEKQRRIFKRGRIGESYLKNADRSKWKVQPGANRRKPIAQYNLKGKLIAKFESITHASKALKLDSKAIIGVAKGKYNQWNGYVWKYL